VVLCIFSWDALECGSLYYGGSFHWVAVVTPTLQWCCFFFYWDALESGSPFLPPVYPLGFSCYSHSQVVLFSYWDAHSWAPFNIIAPFFP
jgi:hypothetical protein